MSNVVKTALESTIQGLKADPAQAQAVFETRSVLGEGTSVKSTARQFEFHFDEPATLGGKDEAPNPVEYALASLGACQAIAYRALAALKGVSFEHVEVKTTGYLNLEGFLGLDEEVRPGLGKVEFETLIVSEESEEKIERLAKQVEALCPVLDIIQNPVKVTGKLTVNKPADALLDA